MQFAASLWSVKTDHEGEATVVLKVPQSELTEIIKLTQMTETLLKVKIEREE